MSTQTETHRFSNLSLTLTGNAVVTRLSGEVSWKLREINDGLKLDRIYHIYLHCEDGALVEIIRDEALWPAVEEALVSYVKTLGQGKARHEDAAPLSTGHETTADKVDNAASEGAQQTSG